MEVTVGRKVWLWNAPGVVLSHEQPFDADVAFVHSRVGMGGSVTLAYRDHEGTQRTVSRVTLTMPALAGFGPAAGPHGVVNQHGDSAAPYATWMPYQVREAMRSVPGASVGSGQGTVVAGGIHPVHAGIAGFNGQTAAGSDGQSGVVYGAGKIGDAS